jgi:hypothetical protein
MLALHFSHLPSQALSQHTLSTQKPLAHSDLSLHAVPFDARLPPAPPALAELVLPPVPPALLV